MWHRAWPALRRSRRGSRKYIRRGQTGIQTGIGEYGIYTIKRIDIGIAQISRIQ